MATKKYHLIPINTMANFVFLLVQRPQSCVCVCESAPKGMVPSMHGAQKHEKAVAQAPPGPAPRAIVVQLPGVPQLQQGLAQLTGEDVIDDHRLWQCGGDRLERNAQFCGGPWGRLGRLCIPFACPSTGCSPGVFFTARERGVPWTPKRLAGQ